MAKDPHFNPLDKGFKLRGSRETSCSLTFIFEYTNAKCTLSEFSLMLSEFFGFESFVFKPLEISDSKKKFYEITFPLK